jgi:hypothetical protein
MAWTKVRFIFSPTYPSLMRVYLVIITSDEKIIVDDVRLHLNPSLQRVFTDMLTGPQNNSC